MNLEKVIKVTQSQYDILASGGRVGEYVGLDDNYLYLIEDENEYLPITGGTITGDLTINGNTTFKNNSTYTPGKGIEFQYNNGGYTGTGLSINCDNVSAEIIYLGTDENGDPLYKPLLVDDNHEIIYSDDSNYHNRMDLATASLVVNDEYSSGNYITLTPNDNCIYYYDSTDDIEYSYAFPQASGAIALESYVQANPQTTTATLTGIKIGNTSYAIDAGSNIVLNNTVGSESITDTDNNITLNVMTRDTAQNISSVKTFLNGFETSYTENDLTTKYKVIQNTLYNLDFQYQNNSVFTLSTSGIYSGKSMIPKSNNTYDIGTSSMKWRDLYLSGIGYIDKVQTSKSQFLVNIGVNTDFAFEHLVFRPAGNANTDLGTNVARWKDFYLSNNITDGTNSITVEEIVAKQDAIEVKRYI